MCLAGGIPHAVLIGVAGGQFGIGAALFEIAPHVVHELRARFRPAALLVPVPEGLDAAELDIYYFSESQLHPGWYLGDNVVGWIVPGSRETVIEDGRTYIRIEVNHSGVFQLGKSVKAYFGGSVIRFGVTGGRERWALLALVLAGLGAGLVRTARRRRVMT